jgi:hypothetical protein
LTGVMRWHRWLAFTAVFASANPSFAQSLDQQSKCGSEAERTFTHEGSIEDGVTRTPGDHYDTTAQSQSRYNPTLNRCIGPSLPALPVPTPRCFDAGELRPMGDRQHPVEQL